MRFGDGEQPERIRFAIGAIARGLDALPDGFEIDGIIHGWI